MYSVVVDISPMGDTILIVGPDFLRLRVHSQCLQSASEVFLAMFRPDWDRYQSRSFKSPAEISLPKDDADAMQTIGCVIHHRNNLLPEDLTAKDVLQIAILVDKYDLRVALNFAMLKWLKPRSPVGLVETGRLLAAAFLLDSAEAFMTHIKTLVLEQGKSYLVMMKDELISQVLPLEICRM
jgi:hypothetical protein